MKKLKEYFIDQKLLLIFYQAVSLIFMLQVIIKSFPEWITGITFALIGIISGISIYYKTWGK